MVGVALVVSTLGLVVPTPVQAAVGTPCKKVGQTRQVVVKKKRVTLTCVAKGKKRTWSEMSKNPLGAKVYDASAAKFVAMAGAVRDWQAQCMMVMKNGRVVAEWNFERHQTDTNVESASVTKSFASTLVGIASRKGLLNIDERASKYITEWVSAPIRDVTIRQLLAMTSGVKEWVVDPSKGWYGSGDARAQVAGATSIMGGPDLNGNYRAQLPGKRWNYHNMSTASLELVLSRATGETVQAFANRELFQPLGLSVDIMGDSKNVPLLAVGFRLGCDDLAKLVQLYLNNGMWNGVQILDASYVKDALSSQVTCGECLTSGWESSQMNGAYGLSWWLNAAAPSACTGFASFCQLSTTKGPTMPSLPTDLFYASGACNQIGAGLPSQGLVVVVMRKGCNEPSEGVWLTNRQPAIVFFEELAKAYK
jgi:CubicO group peptidase (beta-lactamase class C family)